VEKLEIKKFKCYENEPGTLNVLVTSIRKGIVHYLIHNDVDYAIKSKASVDLFTRVYPRVGKMKE